MRSEFQTSDANIGVIGDGGPPHGRDQPPTTSCAAPSKSRRRVLKVSGGGVYFFWKAGVLKYLMHHHEMHAVRLRGTSAGALIATLAACNVDLDRAVSAAHDLAQERGVYDRPLGLAGVWGRMIRQWLEDLLPPDCHRRCQGRVEVCVTRIPSFKPVIIGSFETRQEVIDACMASVHIPFFLDGRPTASVQGMYAVDGGISNYVPVRLRLPPLIPKSLLGRKALPWKISRQGSSGGASRQGSAGCPSRQGSAGCASRQGSLGCPSRQGSLTSASHQGSLGCPSRQGSWGRTLKTLRTKSGQQQQPLWRKGSGGLLASPPGKGAHTLLRAKSGVDFELDYTMDGRLDQSRFGFIKLLSFERVQQLMQKGYEFGAHLHQEGVWTARLGMRESTARRRSASHTSAMQVQQL